MKNLTLTTAIEFDAIFKKMDEVEKALLDGKGRYTRPVACTEGRFYNKT